MITKLASGKIRNPITFIYFKEIAYVNVAVVIEYQYFGAALVMVIGFSGKVPGKQSLIEGIKGKSFFSCL